MCEKCNHNINDDKTTILFNIDKRTMCFPHIIPGVCKECEEQFKFVKNNNKYQEIRYGDEDDSY